MSNVKTRIRDQSLFRAILALTPGTVFMLVFIWRTSWIVQGERRFTLFDDALISMAYGRTLTQTGEFVWFPGADHVQGVTNPLWSLVMSLIHITGLDGSNAALAVSLLGMGLILAIAGTTVAILNLTSASYGGNRNIGVIAGACVPFLYPTTYWTLRGMEVGLLALLTILTVLGFVLASRRSGSSRAHRRGLLLLTVASALGILTRIDFMIITVTCFALLIFFAGNRARRQEVLLWMIVPVLVLVCVLSFQYEYWGDLLPNTYRLKIEGVPAFERLLRGGFAAGKSLPAMVMAVVSALIILRYASDSIMKRVTVLILTIILSVFAYSIWVGGDAWEWSLILNRYIATLLPLVLVLAFLAFQALLTSRKETRFYGSLAIMLLVSGLGLGLVPNPISINPRLCLIGGVISAISILFIWLAILLVRSSRLGNRRAVFAGTLFGIAVLIISSGPGAILWVTSGGLNVHEDQQFAERSQAISEVTMPNARVAVMWAGAPGYYSHRRLIDMFGKSDRSVASLAPRPVTENGVDVGFVPGHNKWDYQLSIRDEHPDMVFQLNNPTQSEIAMIKSWGYVEMCFADGWHSYFLEGSPLIKWSALSPC